MPRDDDDDDSPAFVTKMRERIRERRLQVKMLIEKYNSLESSEEKRGRAQQITALSVFSNNEIDCPGTATRNDALEAVEQFVSGEPVENDPSWSVGRRICANQMRAWLFFEKHGFSISREVIEATHALLVEGDIVAPGLRQVPAMSANGAAVYPDHNLLPALLADWLVNVNEAINSGQCPYRVAAYAMTTFVHVHPFEDGNGRLSRIIANGILQRLGFPLVVIPSAQGYLKSIVQDQKYLVEHGKATFLHTTVWMLESAIQTLNSAIAYKVPTLEHEDDF